MSGEIWRGDNQVFLTLKYFHTNVLVFVKVRLEHSILSDILLFFSTKYLVPFATCQVLARRALIKKHIWRNFARIDCKRVLTWLEFLI